MYPPLATVPIPPPPPHPGTQNTVGDRLASGPGGLIYKEASCPFCLTLSLPSESPIRGSALSSSCFPIFALRWRILTQHHYLGLILPSQRKFYHWRL
jgi:hypothetical protein